MFLEKLVEPSNGYQNNYTHRSYNGAKVVLHHDVGRILGEFGAQGGVVGNLSKENKYLWKRLRQNLL